MGMQVFASQRQINKLKEEVQDNCDGATHTHEYEYGEGKHKTTKTHNIIYARVASVRAHLDKQKLLLTSRSSLNYTIGIDKGMNTHTHPQVHVYIYTHSHTRTHK